MLLHVDFYKKTMNTLKKKTPSSFFSSAQISQIIPNILAGLTVSFVALSLGAALGILSERGAFVGMLSAAVAVIITASIGGTRVKCSGPTAPLTVVTALIVGFAHDELLQQIPTANADHFVNTVLFLTAGILFAMAALRMGKYIQYIPNVVVSGFMNGIAVLIWIDQIWKIFGLGGKTSFEGDFWQNIAIVIGTFVLALLIPFLAKKFLASYHQYISGTLFTLIIMTGIVALFQWDIEKIVLGQSITSFADISNLIAEQMPTLSDISLQIILLALPFAFQLAILIYLDTLLTSLVLDKMLGEPTNRSKELMAQGVATGAVASFGGLPGAQATIRSVLLIKENATMRLAGIMVGVFVLIELVLFQDLLGLIPQAVFSGILFKVGLDIIDIKPFQVYIHEIFSPKSHLFQKIFSAHREEKIFVTNREMALIVLTVILTITFDLITAVGVSTVLFYLINKVFSPSNPMRDLAPVTETNGIRGEE